MDSPGYYAIIPASIRYNKELSSNAILLYGEITALVNFKGKCEVEDDYFVRLYKITHKGAAMLLNQLVKAGAITIENNKVSSVKVTWKISIKNGVSSPPLFQADATTKAEKPVITHTVKEFIAKFNKIRGTKYQETSGVKSALISRLKKYKEEDLFKALKNAMQSEFHIEKKFADLTPEFMLREDKIEKYLNQGNNNGSTEFKSQGAQL